ncbi:DUF445 family protein [Duganella sp. FT135W]|uniref:DUF445 family protein n=1 Tax=Duganella flavida TaxID=2692175 RepID=A0A6L8K8N3_9BURK|nr:DUF445 family protein [Duganella flavida]
MTKEEELKRSKLLALSLLAGVCIVFVVTSLLPRGLWTDGLRAVSEAAMVGALADWFAVVALFRKVPIPFVSRHTAIIPNNKDRIADNLAGFVEDKFLKPESLAAVILKTDPATSVAAWLKEPANRSYLATHLAKLVPEILATADDARIQQLLKDALHAAIGKLDMAPTLGTVIGGLTRDGRHQELLDDGMRALIGLLNRPSTREVIAELIASWLKREHAAMELVLPTEWISDNGAVMIASTLNNIMENVAADKDHKLRLRFDEMVQSFVVRLQTDPAFIAKGEEFKHYLRDSETFNRYTLDLWRSVRDWIKADIDAEDSRLNAGVVQASAWLSEELLTHPEMRASLNQHLAGMARTLAPALSSFLTRHISDTVKAWDNKDMSRQIELNIGKDLQFIRVNGTLVGGMVGLLLYVVSTFVHAADIPVTVYADAGYPPYSYEKDGKPAGLYHDIVQAAFSHMQGYKIEVHTVPWKRGMALLKSGTGFALYPPYMNTKDEPWTWPYSQPLFEEHVVAYCRKDVIAAKPRKRWPEDFYGLTIGNNAGFIVGGEAFDAAVKAGHLRIEEGKDSETNIIKLGMKRIDCYINDRVSIQWTLNQLKASGKYHEGLAHAELAEAIQIAANQGYLGYTSRDKGRYTYKSDFVKQFDAAIQQMKRSGEMDTITRNFFKTHQ